MGRVNKGIKEMESIEISKSKRINCYFDGSFKSAKKGGSIGCLTVDANTGKILTKWGKSINCKDSFEAELIALHQLLVHIRKHKKKNTEFREAELVIMGDNQSLIDAINGHCKMPRYSITRSTLVEYERLCNENNVELIWIRREDNKQADKITKSKNVVGRALNYDDDIEQTFQRLENTNQIVHALINHDMVSRIERLENQIQLNNCLMSKLVIIENLKQSNVIDEECLWRVLEYYQGKEFRTIRGKSFSYEVDETHLKVKGVIRKISKRDILRALEKRPIESLAQIKHINGSSYIYAILKDSRIWVQ